MTVRTNQRRDSEMSEGPLSQLNSTTRELLVDAEEATQHLVHTRDQLVELRRVVRQMPHDVSDLLDEWSELASELDVPVRHEWSAHHFVMDTYAWTAVHLFAGGLAKWLCWPVIARIALFVDNWALIFIAFAVLPGYLYIKNRKSSVYEWSERDRHKRLLQLALLLGAVSGYMTSHLQLSFTPTPAFLMPLLLALFAGLVGPLLASNRRLYLLGTIGTSYAIVSALGWQFMRQRSVGFFLHTTVMAAFSFYQFQVTIARANRYLPTVPTTFESQLRVVLMHVAAECLVMMAMGTLPPSLAPTPFPSPPNELFGASLCCGGSHKVHPL